MSKEYSSVSGGNKEMESAVESLEAVVLSKKMETWGRDVTGKGKRAN